MEFTSDPTLLRRRTVAAPSPAQQGRSGQDLLAPGPKDKIAPKPEAKSGVSTVALVAGAVLAYAVLS